MRIDAWGILYAAIGLGLRAGLNDGVLFGTCRTVVKYRFIEVIEAKKRL